MSSDFPERYNRSLYPTFYDSLLGLLREDISILDVGSGRRPALDPVSRPSGCTYDGLDISASELEAAPEGSYDEVWISDLCISNPRLREKYDIVISWQVLEHVSSLYAAVDNVRAYLSPRGVFVAALSGSWGFFSVANRVIPHKIATAAMHHLLGRDPESVFPAHYDHCSFDGLRGAFAKWSSVTITPFYTGGNYLNFSPLIRKVYLTGENFIERRNWRNLATHYLVVAQK